MSKKKKIVNNEQHQRKLSDKQVLREVLEDLTEEGQVWISILPNFWKKSDFLDKEAKFIERIFTSQIRCT